MSKSGKKTTGTEKSGPEIVIDDDLGEQEGSDEGLEEVNEYGELADTGDDEGQTEEGEGGENLPDPNLPMFGPVVNPDTAELDDLKSKYSNARKDLQVKEHELIQLRKLSAKGHLVLKLLRNP
jgi:hypothetical protein